MGSIILGPSDFLKLLAVVALYVLLTQLPHLDAPGAAMTIVWPASGFALAMLLLGGNQYIYAIFLGAFMTYFATGKSIALSCLIALGYSIEAWVGVWLLSERNSKIFTFSSLRNSLRFFHAGCLACIFSALIGSAAFLLNGTLHITAAFQTFLHWWLSDVLGIILVTPTILVWLELPEELLRRNRILELLGGFSVSILIGQMVFLDLYHDTLGQVASIFWLFFCISWMAIRFGLQGTVILSLLISIQALKGAYEGFGYFAHDIAETELLEYWFFMTTLSVVGMILSISSAAFKSSQQILLKSQKVAQDALNALSASESILREAQEAALIGHYIIDLKNSTWKCSSVLNEIFGIETTAQQTLADWMRIVNSSCSEKIFDNDGNTEQDKTRIDKTVKIIRVNDGAERWISVQGKCDYDTDGTILRMVGTIQDITEQKRADLELELHRDHLKDMVEDRTHQLVKAKESAELANQSKSKFLSNMSHELRTPIHAILSFSQLGLDKSKQSNCDLSKLQQYFEHIVRSGNRLLPLVNDLLDLSKLESGKAKFIMMPCDLYQLTLEIVNEISILASDKDIRIDMEDVVQDLIVFCESTKISQVLHNLLANAIKFSPEHSTITLRMKSTGLKGRRANDKTIRPAVEFSVIDQGIGIPEDELVTIFDEFVQSSKTRSSAGGTGLGLSICREIIKGHHGLISAANNAEGGSCLSFTLPIKPFNLASQGESK